MVKRIKTLSLAILTIVASGLLMGAVAKITGTVTSENGDAVEGVVVKAVDENDEVAGEATTDSDGSYVIEGLEEGEYIITANMDGFEGYESEEPVVINEDLDPVEHDIILTATPEPPPPIKFTISGVVLGETEDGEDEEPLEGVTVKLFDDEDNEIGEQTTNSDGEYAFADVEDGAYKIVFSHADFLPDSLENVEVDDGDVDDADITLVRVEIVIPPGPTVSVTAANIVYGETLTVTAECENCWDDPEFKVVYGGRLSRSAAVVTADSIYGPTEVKPTLPGTYYVKATLFDVDGEALIVGASDSVEFNISRKQLVWTDGKVFDKVYDGTSVAVVDSNGVPRITGFVGNDSVGIQISYAADSTVRFADSSVGAGIAVVAAGWKVQLYPFNYAWMYSAPDTVNSQPSFAAASIIKATATGVSQQVFVKAGLEQEYDYNLTNLLPSLAAPKTFGELEYAVSGVDDQNSIFESAPGIEDDSMLVFTISEEAEAGDSALVTVTVKSDNYEDFDVVFTVKVTDKTPVTIEAKMVGGVYNAQAFAFDSLKITNDVTDSLIERDSVKLVVLYESIDSLGAVVSNGVYSDSIGPVNAGFYMLTLAVDEDDENYAGEVVFKFTIERKTVTVKADDIEIEIGDEIPDFTYTVTGFLGSDSLAVKPTLTSDEDIDTDEDGEYTIVIVGAVASDTVNYVIQHVNGTLTIVTDQNSVAADTREIADAKVNEVAVVAPVKITASEFSAGPNPVSRTGGAVNFFRVGQKIESGSLTVYSASGSVVAKISVRDRAADNLGNRQIASWNLKDTRGRAVPEGTYLVRGTVKTVEGKREKVSLMIGVR